VTLRKYGYKDYRLPDVSGGIEVAVQSGDVVRLQRFDHDEADIKIDGHLDEDIWAELRSFDEFGVIEPDTLAIPLHRQNHKHNAIKQHRTLRFQDTDIFSNTALIFYPPAGDRIWRCFRHIFYSAILRPGEEPRGLNSFGSSMKNRYGG